MNRILLIFCLLAGFTLKAAAQGPDTVKTKSHTDSLNRSQDSVTSKRFTPPKTTRIKIYNPDSTHSPGLAFRRSGMIPGWGQLYNRSWWKVPIIYTGLGLLGSAIVFNHSYYRQYLQLAIYKRDFKTPAEVRAMGGKYAAEYEQVTARNVTYQALVDAKDAYNRNFQLSILGTAGAWFIQMIEAYIEAKFIHSYTMDNDLGFRVTPGILGGPVYAANNIGTFMPVLKITFTMK